MGLYVLDRTTSIWQKLGGGPDEVIPGGGTSSGTFQVGYSTSSDAGPYTDMDGATITSAVWVRLIVGAFTGTIAEVEWFLDDVQQRPESPDTGAPYTMQVGNSTQTNLAYWGPSGEHVVRADVIFTDGATESVDATFDVGDASVPLGPPVLTNIQAVSTIATAASVTWTTNMPATTDVDYGLTNAYGLTYRAPALVTAHVAGLTGLTAETTYHYRVRSTNATNEETVNGTDRTFTTTASPPVPPPGSQPTRAQVIANAGLSNPAALVASGSIITTQAGQVIENKDVSGSIKISHNNCVVRNCRVVGASPNRGLISQDRDISGLLIEHCEVEVLSINGGTEKGATGCVGYIGNGYTVRYSRLSGHADGVKLESNTLAEYNYVTTSKPPGGDLHCDGVQGSADSNVTVRYNVIEQPTSEGGNAAVFLQCWNGSANFPCSGWVVHGNYLKGGNNTLGVNGGKDRDGSDPASWLLGARVTNNFFYQVNFFYDKSDPVAIAGQDAEDIVRFGYITQIKPSVTYVNGNRYYGGGTADGQLITTAKPAGAYNTNGFAQDPDGG